MTPASDRLQLVSHFPGRLRVRAEPFRLRPELAEEVARQIEGEPGVLSVKTSRITGSIVVSYEPRDVQLPRLVKQLVVAGGLRGIEVDEKLEWARLPAQGTLVREALGSLTERTRDLTGGAVDVRVAVPGALVTGGLAMFLLGRRRVPEWYDLIFWAFVTFVNLNPRADGSETSHPETSGGSRR